jgi:hypothetical protein
MSAPPPPIPLPSSPLRNPNAIPDAAPPTPVHQHARIANYEAQIAQLLTSRSLAERKHRSELAGVKSQLAEAVGERDEWKGRAGKEGRRVKEAGGEVERCEREGREMREEVRSLLFSTCCRD